MPSQPGARGSQSQSSPVREVPKPSRGSQATDRLGPPYTPWEPRGLVGLRTVVASPVWDAWRMAFSEKQLGTGEHVELHLRTHWKALIWPAVALSLIHISEPTRRTP